MDDMQQAYEANIKAGWIDSPPGARKAFLRNNPELCARLGLRLNDPYEDGYADEGCEDAPCDSASARLVETADRLAKLNRKKS